MLSRVLVLVEPAALRKRVERLLAQLDVVQVPGPRRGAFWGRVKRQSADIVLVSYPLLPQPAAQSVAALGDLPDRPDVVVLWAEENPELEATLVVAGCRAVVNQDLPSGLLRDTLEAVLKRREELAAHRLVSELREDEPRLADFASSSPIMQAFMGMVQRIVATDSTLLIQGESGVGKERLARAIHLESSRGAGPLIAVNCGALSETLLESELFGHEEGAFTGAVRARRGFFELAHRGTIFLDEIGDLPLHLQVKLLRVLQERTIQRLGGEEPLSIDVRVMAATNRDLAAEVEAKRFRQDLYYRLAVVTLDMPPLRQRREDIPLLLAGHLQRFRARFGRHLEGFSSAAHQALVAYDWPGNVRELINVVERAVLLARGNEIELDDLPGGIGPGQRAAAGQDLGELLRQSLGRTWSGLPWRTVRRAVVDACERTYLADLLAQSGGKIGETAARAGMGVRALSGKMRKLGLNKEDFRGTPRD